jgi:hypothetical protein
VGRKLAICATVKQIANLFYRKEPMHFSPPLYLDPGSSSMIWQLIIAALLGVAVAVRASWGRIKKLFGKGQADEPTDDDADANQ